MSSTKRCTTDPLHLLPTTRVQPAGALTNGISGIPSGTGYRWTEGRDNGQVEEDWYLYRGASTSGHWNMAPVRMAGLPGQENDGELGTIRTENCSKCGELVVLRWERGGSIAVVDDGAAAIGRYRPGWRLLDLKGGPALRQRVGQEDAITRFLMFTIIHHQFAQGSPNRKVRVERT